MAGHSIRVFPLKDELFDQVAKHIEASKILIRQSRQIVAQSKVQTEQFRETNDMCFSPMKNIDPKRFKGY
jgi:hypothetical protein